MQRKTQWGTRWAVLVTAVALALIGGLSRPSSVAAQTYVIDFSAGTGGQGALFRVDPTTGARTLLSDFGVGANPGQTPFGVAVEPGGSILVIDPTAGTGLQGALFRVDPTTGARTLLSDFGVGANPGQPPVGVAIEPGGSILVTDEDAGTGGQGALFRVDPTTGARALLSDFGLGANPGVDPFGVAVSAASATGIPTLSEWAQIGMAALLVGGGLVALRRRKAAISDQRSALS